MTRARANLERFWDYHIDGHEYREPWNRGTEFLFISEAF